MKLNNYNDSEFEKVSVIKEYPKLEASTVAVIRAAEKNGIKYEVINESKSFVKFYNDKKAEYVVQATKTSADLATFAFIANSKEYVKHVLREHGISVPDGIMLDESMTKWERNNEMKKYVGKKVVIKPNTTNCGVGITIYNKNATLKEIQSAVNKAFKYDTNVIIETFEEGKEYRFLVVDGKCICVINRRSASVVGDGKKTIRELIDLKNKEPWHYITHAPITIDKSMETILKRQNLTLDYVPKKDERVFVRKTSNCSTGGESVAYTDEMPDKFKRVAEKATNLFGAKICGVDMLIEDFNVFKYSIVEINDNPGIDICEWPYEGEGTKVGEAVLKLLKFI